MGIGMMAEWMMMTLDENIKDSPSIERAQTDLSSLLSDISPHTLVCLKCSSDPNLGFEPA